MTSEQRIVIVGGGPAALSTARSYREAGGEAAVDVVCAEPHLPYQRPPLTKELLRGELEPGGLALEDEPWFAAHAVTLRRGRAAVALDRAARSVHLDGGQVLPYDACVLATGSAPDDHDPLLARHASKTSMRKASLTSEPTCARARRSRSRAWTPSPVDGSMLDSGR